MTNQYDPFKDDSRFGGSAFTSNPITNRSPLASGPGTNADQDSSMFAGLFVLFCIAGLITALKHLGVSAQMIVDYYKGLF